MRWKHREGSCDSPASASPLQPSSLAFIQEARRHSSGTDELLRVILSERFIDLHWAMWRCKTKDNRWYAEIRTPAMTWLHYGMIRNVLSTLGFINQYPLLTTKCSSQLCGHFRENCTLRHTSILVLFFLLSFLKLGIIELTCTLVWSVSPNIQPPTDSMSITIARLTSWFNFQNCATQPLLNLVEC